MKDLGGMLWSLWLIALAGWLLGNFWAYTSLRFADNHYFSPDSRARRILLLAALPWLLPLILITLLNAVPLVKANHWLTDHCRDHSHGHLHACDATALSFNLPLDLGYANLAVTGLIMLFLFTNFLRLLWREWQMHQRLHMLSVFAHGRQRLRVLDDQRPIALAAGLHNRFVLLSTGLLQQLTYRERRVVLVHEFAHLRRADPLRNLVFEFLLTLHLPWQATTLRRLWQQAQEEAADDAAVSRFGRDTVASTLLRVIRVSQAYRTERCSAVGANAVQRIQRLLSSGEHEPRSFVFESAHMLGLLALGTLAFFHHHTLETLAAWIAGV